MKSVFGYGAMAGAVLVLGARVLAEENSAPYPYTSTTVTREAHQVQMMRECITRRRLEQPATTVSDREQDCATEVAAKLNLEAALH